MYNSPDISVSLLIEERSGRARIKEPVTVGVPLRQGAVHDPASLNLFDPLGRQCPVQTETLAHWFDGSAKWVLFDFTADVGANTQAVYVIRSGKHQPSAIASPSLSIKASAEQIVIDTSKAIFCLNRNVCKPFDRVVIDQADLLLPDGSSFELTDEKGEVYVPHIENLEIESKGPLRVTVRASGKMQSSSGRNMARFVTLLSFYKGSSFVEIRNTLHNPKAARHPGGLWDLGDEGSIYFTDLSLHVLLATQKNPSVRWKTQPIQLFRKQAAVDVEIYQDSSGGENWQSTNHVNRFGQVTQSFRGYRVTAEDCMIEEGLRATPILTLGGNVGGLAATLDKFWQNFPKAIGAHQNDLVVRLFPKQFSDYFELQGGEQKTHTIYLEFTGPGEVPADLSWAHNRLLPRATPEWYAETNACSYLSPVSQDSSRECQGLINVAIDGQSSFFARREIIDEYGWRHFGDLYADHEAVNHSGDAPLVAHYNNQYDVIYGSLIQYLRSGDARWFELMHDLARHVIDIDIYHTEEDRPAYNNGLFWHTDHYLDAGIATHRTYSKSNLKAKVNGSYGGGPSNEHNYTSGLLHYYYLTGDQAAREAVLSLANWVTNMDDGRQRRFGCIDRRSTGLASSTATRDYHGPGRGAANSINALLDAYAIQPEDRHLKKAEQIVRRCIHPNDNINDRNLDDPEHRWSYLVFLQALGKYLDVKIETGEIEFMYAYAQASLLHYAEWMLDYEVPYSAVLDKVEIPTETWPAQDIRKAAVFHLAAKHSIGIMRGAFRQKAAYFFDVCLRDLAAFPTCTLTRPLVLLLTNASVHAYFQHKPLEMAPQVSKSFEFGEPRPFIAQFSCLFRLRELISYFRRALQPALRRVTANLKSNPAQIGSSHG